MTEVSPSERLRNAEIMRFHVILGVEKYISVLHPGNLYTLRESGDRRGLVLETSDIVCRLLYRNSSVLVITELIRLLIYLHCISCSNSALTCLHVLLFESLVNPCHSMSSVIFHNMAVAMGISTMHEKSWIDLHNAGKFEKRSKIQSFTYLAIAMMKPRK